MGCYGKKIIILLKFILRIHSLYSSQRCIPWKRKFGGTNFSGLARDCYCIPGRENKNCKGLLLSYLLKKTIELKLEKKSNALLRTCKDLTFF